MMRNIREELRSKQQVSKVFHHPQVGIVGPTQHGKMAAVGGRQGISVDTARLLPQDARVTSHVYAQEDGPSLIEAGDKQTLPIWRPSRIGQEIPSLHGDFLRCQAV